MKRLTEGLLGEVTGQSVHHSEEGRKKKREMSVFELKVHHRELGRFPILKGMGHSAQVLITEDTT